LGWKIIGKGLLHLRKNSRHFLLILFSILHTFTKGGPGYIEYYR
jgi:hypothetical protein